MQTDQSTDSATATSRRTFLTRAAVGGALVTAGALVLPNTGLIPAAGARPAKQGDLKDDVFADFGTALELAAVTAYSAAFDKDVLDDEWSALALKFQGHHQDVADILVELRDPDLPEAVAHVEFTKTSVDAIKAASDQDGVLAALAVVEETCAASHLSAIGQLAEKSTARTVAQVLCVEGQQAALLGMASGSTMAEVTPVTDSGDAALTIPKNGVTAPTTTSTTAAAATTDESTTTTQAGDSDTPTSDADTKTSAPSSND